MSDEHVLELDRGEAAQHCECTTCCCCARLCYVQFIARARDRATGPPAGAGPPCSVTGQRITGLPGLLLQLSCDAGGQAGSQPSGQGGRAPRHRETGPEVCAEPPTLTAGASDLRASEQAGRFQGAGCERSPGNNRPLSGCCSFLLSHLLALDNTGFQVTCPGTHQRPGPS